MHLSIRLRLVAGLGIVALAAGGAAFGAARAADRIRDAAAASARHAAQELADRLSGAMAASSREVAALARLDVSRSGSIDRAALRGALATPVDARDDAASWIAVTDTDGRIVAGHPAAIEGRSLAERPAFHHGRLAPWTGDGGAAASQPDHDEDFAAVDLAAPWKGADGRLRGVVALHRSGRWAETLRDQVAHADAASTGIALAIVGADGRPRLGDAPHAAHASGGIAAEATSRPLGDFRGFGWRVVAWFDPAAIDARIGAARQRIWGWSLGIGAAVAAALAAALGRQDRQRPVHADGPPAMPRRDRRRASSGDVAGALARLRASLGAWGGSERRAADPLTGLPNRTALTRLARELAEDGSLMAHEFSVVCLDLDDFRTVNERFGRSVGDRALRDVAIRIRQTARADDIVLRLGGDEFVVIAPASGDGVDSASARIADRLLTALQRPFEGLGPSALVLGGSIGTAQWRPGGPLLVEVIAQAGEALLAAKRAGRQQVRHYASRRGRKAAMAEAATPMP